MLREMMDDDDFSGALLHRKKEIFFGPHSLLIQECAEGTQASAETVRCFLQRTDAAICTESGLGIDRKTFDVIHQIAMIYVREPDSKIDLQRLSLALNGLVSVSNLPSATSDDIVAYEDARAALRLAKPADKWTAADWQMLGFANDAISPPESAKIPIERTPVFVADDHIGRVLWLAADRIPGPAMVTPHWWRIGLVPLGPNRELVTAIQKAMQAVINGDDDRRHHIRWWIEEHPGGGGWFEEIGEAGSAQVAAACVARALREPEVSHPILDPKAGVSATFDTSVAATDSTPIGKVDEVRKKTKAAQDAGINTFVLESNCAKKTKSEWSDYTNDPDRPLAVQKVTTFGDAYEALLAMSSHIQKAKTTCWQGWGTFIDKEAPANSESRGSRHEAETEQRYIDASKKQQ